MYVKPSRKQIRGVYVPENYNGTAFDDHENDQNQAASESQQESAPREQAHNLPPALAAPAEATPASAGLLSIFSGFGGLRSDDILLLALILLLSRSDKEAKGASEILPLLAILLFIG